MLLHRLVSLWKRFQRIPLISDLHIPIVLVDKKFYPSLRVFLFFTRFDFPFQAVFVRRLTLPCIQDPERILKRSQLTEQWVNREVLHLLTPDVSMHLA